MDRNLPPPFFCIYCQTHLATSKTSRNHPANDLFLENQFLKTLSTRVCCLNAQLTVVYRVVIEEALLGNVQRDIQGFMILEIPTHVLYIIYYLPIY